MAIEIIVYIPSEWNLAYHIQFGRCSYTKIIINKYLHHSGLTLTQVCYGCEEASSCKSTIHYVIFQDQGLLEHSGEYYRLLQSRISPSHSSGDVVQTITKQIYKVLKLQFRGCYTYNITIFKPIPNSIKVLSNEIWSKFKYW